MSRALRLVILAATGLLGALSTSFVMALRQRPHPTPRQIRAVLFDNWGLYSNFQLGLGLLLAATWILCVHRRKWVAALWVVGLALVGHMATLAYILWRARSARTVGDVFMPQPAYETAAEVVVPETPGTAIEVASDEVQQIAPVESPETVEPTEPVIHACNAVFNVELPEPVAHATDVVQPAPVDEPA